MARLLAVPFRLLPSGNLATVLEDSAADVAQSVRTLLLTRPGERLMSPDLGTPDPVFVGLDPEQVAAVVQEQEDRASVSVVASQLADVQSVRVTLDPR